MELATRLDDASLTRIMEQAAIYFCACPSQVAHLLTELRRAHAYQRQCLEQGSDLVATHETIIAALQQCHEVLESCLEDVMRLEGWDRTTLEMPENLRQLQINALLQDDRPLK